MTPSAAARHFQKEFFSRVGAALELTPLFDPPTAAALFIKDEQSRFVRCNRRELELLGCTHEWQAIGKSDFDFFAPEIASLYAAEDQQVMRANKPVYNLQMVPVLSGQHVRWYMVAKTPIHDLQGKVCGVAGTLHESHGFDGPLRQFHQLEPALRHLHLHYSETIETRALAGMVNLSERQFTRLFRRLLGQAPMRYLIRQRVHAACQQLIGTDYPIGRIAQDCGFYDQSAFTRVFSSLMGVTPLKYRRTHLGATQPGLPEGRLKTES